MVNINKLFNKKQTCMKKAAEKYRILLHEDINNLKEHIKTLETEILERETMLLDAKKKLIEFMEFDKELVEEMKVW